MLEAFIVGILVGGYIGWGATWGWLRRDADGGGGGGGGERRTPNPPPNLPKAFIFLAAGDTPVPPGWPGGEFQPHRKVR